MQDKQNNSDIDQISRHAVSRKNILAAAMLIAAVLIIAMTVLLAPKYHVRQYVVSITPIVEQIETHTKIVQLKTFNPEIAPAADMSVILQRHKDQLGQLETSKQIMQSLEGELNEVRFSYKVTNYHESLSILMEKAKEVMAKSKTAIIVRQEAAISLRGFNESFNDFTAYFELAGATLPGVIQRGGKVDKELAVSLSALQSIDPDPDQKKYIGLTIDKLNVTQKSLRGMMASLSAEDLPGYLRYADELAEGTSMLNQEIDLDQEIYYKESQLASDFKDLNQKVAESKTGLEALRR